MFSKTNKKKMTAYIINIFLIFSIILFFVLTIAFSYKTIICTEKIDATALFTNGNHVLIKDRLNQKISYSYNYNNISYIGQDYTSYDKVLDIDSDGATFIYICKENPSISIYDKKTDLILFSFGNLILFVSITIYYTLKVKFKK